MGVIAAQPPQAIVYDSATRQPPMVEELVELIHYRGLLRLLVTNSLKTRYRRSVLGVMWTLLNPLLTMLVLTVVFSRLFRGSLEHYPVYVLSGLLFWNFFSQATTSAMHALVWGGQLIRRVYMPRTIFTLAAVGTNLVNLLVGLLPLAAIMLALGHPFRLSLLVLPLSILLAAMFALGVSLCLSILAVYFTDVIDMYDVLLRALLFLSAVMYPASIVPEQYAWILRFNPLFRLLELFRVPVYAGRVPAPGDLFVMLVVAGGALLTGWGVFARQADELAYRL